MKKIAIILIILSFLGLPLVALADIGPKPSADFHFNYEMAGSPTIVSGTLLQCSDTSCSDAKPLEAVGPQRFSCEEKSCSSMAYSYGDYLKLVIKFSDGVERTSNVFKSSDSMNARYTVQVFDDYLSAGGGSGITEPSQALGLLFLGLYLGLITMVIEVVVGLIFLLITRVRGEALLKMIGLIALVNIISFCLFYALLWLTNGGLIYYIAGEVGVIIIEAVLLYYFSRKTFSLKRSFVLSLIMNIASAGLGLLVSQGIIFSF